MRVSSGSITNAHQRQRRRQRRASNGRPTTQPGAAPDRDRTAEQPLATECNNDFWGDLRDDADAIVGKDGGRSVIVNPQSGVIVIRALPDELRNVDGYLKATQLVIDRQVILEAKIIEVELNDSFQSGVNWAAFRDRAARLSAGLIAPGAVL